MDHTAVSDVRSPLRDFWAITATVNTALSMVGADLSARMVRSIFTEQFRCRHPFVPSLVPLITGEP